MVINVNSSWITGTSNNMLYEGWLLLLPHKLSTV
jgi:hypothetical protein